MTCSMSCALCALPITFGARSSDPVPNLSLLGNELPKPKG